MATLRTQDLTKSYGGRTVVRGVSLEVNSGEVVGLLGPERRGQDHDLLHDGRADGARFGPRHSQRRGCHRRCRCTRGRARASDICRRNRRFFAASRSSRTSSRFSRRSIWITAGRRARLPRAAGRAESDIAGLSAGLHAVGRRAAARRNHARAGHLAAVPAARRAVRRHRSHRHHRHPEDHFSS